MASASLGLFYILLSRWMDEIAAAAAAAFLLLLLLLLLLHLLDSFFLVFALLLSYLPGLGFPLQDLLAVLVQL